MGIYGAIKNVASNRNVSIYRIEKDLGFTKGSINKWDHSMPGADKLQKVAAYLGVTTDALLNMAKEKEIITN